jgi:RNA recognition motif-containing protein
MCIFVKGLPEDITEEEINEYFSKAGMIKLDF